MKIGIVITLIGTLLLIGILGVDLWAIAVGWIVKFNVRTVMKLGLLIELIGVCIILTSFFRRGM